MLKQTVLFTAVSLALAANAQANDITATQESTVEYGDIAISIAADTTGADIDALQAGDTVGTEDNKVDLAIELTNTNGNSTGNGVNATQTDVKATSLEVGGVVYETELSITQNYSGSTAVANQSGYGIVAITQNGRDEVEVSQSGGTADNANFLSVLQGSGINSASQVSGIDQHGQGLVMTVEQFGPTGLQGSTIGQIDQQGTDNTLSVVQGTEGAAGTAASIDTIIQDGMNNDLSITQTAGSIGNVSQTGTNGEITIDQSGGDLTHVSQTGDNSDLFVTEFSGGTASLTQSADDSTLTLAQSAGALVAAQHGTGNTANLAVHNAGADSNIYQDGTGLMLTFNQWGAGTHDVDQLGTDNTMTINHYDNLAGNIVAYQDGTDNTMNLTLGSN